MFGRRRLSEDERAAIAAIVRAVGPAEVAAYVAAVADHDRFGRFSGRRAKSDLFRAALLLASVAGPDHGR